MLEQIKERIEDELRKAAPDKKKIATLHLQVLMHADELAGTDAKDFCRALGLRPSFVTEYRKMLSLAQLMRQHGIELRPSAATAQGERGRAASLARAAA
ncbi:HTH-like domain-containing protein [Lampropedia cohaerens]|uniref:HTH-like domain-containing protein n=1 Tax=Lampropedia cohaerens TaxID=1610491 RepID=UPI00069A8C24|nr:hypothetical protein [Lampropedia cohaerens]